MAVISAASSNCIDRISGFPDSLYDSYVTVSYIEFGGSKHSNATLTVNVLSAPEKPILRLPMNFSISENAVPSAMFSESLIQYTSDEDFGASYTYSLEDKDRLGLFFINPSDGRLGFVGKSFSLNFESIQSYNISVRVTDNEGLFSKSFATVIVLDENEKPRIEPHHYRRYIVENSVIGSPAVLSTLGVDHAVDDDQFCVTDEDGGAEEKSM